MKTGTLPQNLTTRELERLLYIQGDTLGLMLLETVDEDVLDQVYEKGHDRGYREGRDDAFDEGFASAKGIEK